MNPIKAKNLCVLSLIVLTFTACNDPFKQPKEDEEERPQPTTQTYIYPFGSEARDVTAEITIHTNTPLAPTTLLASIPNLKYNKSWLLMLTQDDCKQGAYCRTWTAINGKPISNSDLAPGSSHYLYFDAAHLRAGDLPPTILPANETLGSTDGCGNEVRFHITTTLSPESAWMGTLPTVNPGYTSNYYRFYMKPGLIWDNVIDMLNYGSGIAFHDVAAADVNSAPDIAAHFAIAQDTINQRLNGRNCKMLAEPNGNKTYVTAARQYNAIQTMVAQAGTVKLYPFKVTDDLQGALLHRVFETPDKIKTQIESQLQIPASEREAIHIGVHETDNSWISLLRWVNDTHGKQGDDSVWFPSQEEYYEYNYYRTHSKIEVIQTDENTIKLIVNLPSAPNFYYPSTTINLSGITQQQIVSISTNDAVSGLSYGNYTNGLTLNIDCRKHLDTHAVHFTEQYEADRSDKTKRADAIYFINQLKDSPAKTALLKRVG